MTKLTDEEWFDRLPKWAQIKLNNLERIVERQRKLIEEHPPTNTSIYTYTEPERFLPDNARIRFYVSEPEGEYGYRRYIEAKLDKGKLRLMGSASLVVQPHVTNVINVGAENR